MSKQRQFINLKINKKSRDYKRSIFLSQPLMMNICAWDSTCTTKLTKFVSRGRELIMTIELQYYYPDPYCSGRSNS